MDAITAAIRKAAAASAALEFARRGRQRWIALRERGRPPTPEEIEGLERRGNSCSGWNRLLLTGEPGLEAVWDCRFEGDVVLRGDGGPPRLHAARFRDCMVGSAEVDGAGLLDRVWIEDAASIRSIGEISGRVGSRYCLGTAIHPGSEMGARRVLLLDGLLLEDCEAMAGLPPQSQESLNREWETIAGDAAADFCHVGSGARIELTPLVEDCFLGGGAMVRGAAALRRSVLASDAEAPVRVGDAALVEDCVLEAGAAVDSAGQARRSLLLEWARIEKSGQATDSVLGPNTHIAKGEVNSCLLGPFVGFHHQALLIAALWPEGRGNVGYGANVGSNHTGRLPDQEIRPGEGAFFGLGCSVKFPANFSEAPYTLFATGVTTLPQRLRFPFSLVAPSPSPETAGRNEIWPGWMWGENTYALIRSAYKFQDRDRARRPLTLRPPAGSPLEGTFLAAGLFSPRIAALAAKALEILRGAAGGAVLLPQDLEGLGENFLRRERIPAALAAYENYLFFALARFLLWEAEPAETPIPDWAEGRIPDADAGEALLRGLQKAVENPLEKDLRRGRRIFDDYREFHPSPQEDPVCRRLSRDLGKLAGPLRQRLEGL